MERLDGIELGVPAQSTKLIFSQWKPEDVMPKMELEQTWVHVIGVPNPLCHFWGLWAVGSLIGATVDVDMLALQRQGVVQILVGMRPDVTYEDAYKEGTYIKTAGVLKF